MRAGANADVVAERPVVDVVPGRVSFACKRRHFVPVQALRRRGARARPIRSRQVNLRRAVPADAARTPCVVRWSAGTTKRATRRAKARIADRTAHPATVWLGNPCIRSRLKRSKPAAFAAATARSISSGSWIRPNAFRCDGVERLRADRQSVDARRAIRREIRFVDSAWIRLERHFGGVCRRRLDRGLHPTAPRWCARR